MSKTSEEEHRLLASWAASCAEHVLPFFEADYPLDNRPRKAIAAARAAGHAAATAHVASHARYAASYALKATQNSSTERAWQLQQLPYHLQTILQAEHGKKDEC